MTTENSPSQVKRFVASNMRRALDLVSAELGPEAVILSSRRVDKGVEIITALEPDLPTRGIEDRRAFSQNFDSEMDRAMASDSAWRTQMDVDKAAASYTGSVSLQSSGMGSRPPSADLAKEIEIAREKMLEAKRQSSRENEPRQQEAVATDYAVQQPLNTAVIKQSEVSRDSINSSLIQREQLEGLRASAVENANPNYSHDIQGSDANNRAVNYNNTPANSNKTESPEDEKRLVELQDELSEMRMLLEQQMWQMSENRSHNTGPSFQSGPMGNMPQQMNMPRHFAMLNEHLARLGLPERMASSLIQEVGSCKRMSEAWRKCMGILSKSLPMVSGDLLENGGVFAFVGQTGVGKTTTIAKLAAQYVLKHGQGKVALITTDTYRVGAYDQLRSVGRILNVPVRAVDSENSLLTLLASLRNYPLVLIDTAGFRHGDPLLKAQLKQLDACRSLKKILVLASTSQQQTMKASVHAFAANKELEAAIITKLDETSSLGEALSVIWETGLPVAYSTDGQEIPNDITLANGHNLVAKAVQLMKVNQTNLSQSAGNL